MDNNEPIHNYKEDFTDKGLWAKLKAYAKQAGIKVVYTALLLYHAYQRKETPRWAKTIVIGTLGYFLAPIDGIPDLTPFIGYTDDLGILSVGLVAVAAYIDKDVRLAARTQLDQWFGKYDETELNEIDEKL